MAEREAAAGREVAEGGLGVLPRAAAGRGVAGVADGQVPDHARQRRLVEDLRDQAQLLVDHDRAAVADRHPGRLLPAVLQRVEAVVGQLGDVLAGRPDAEDAALLTDGCLGLVRVELVLLAGRHAGGSSRNAGGGGAHECTGAVLVGCRLAGAVVPRPRRVEVSRRRWCRGWCSSCQRPWDLDRWCIDS